jgi:hypothetical protein
MFTAQMGSGTIQWGFILPAPLASEKKLSAHDSEGPFTTAVCSSFFGKQEAGALLGRFW